MMFMMSNCFFRIVIPMMRLFDLLLTSACLDVYNHHEKRYFSSDIN